MVLVVEATDKFNEAWEPARELAHKYLIGKKFNSLREFHNYLKLEDKPYFPLRSYFSLDSIYHPVPQDLPLVISEIKINAKTKDASSGALVSPLVIKLVG